MMEVVSSLKCKVHPKYKGKRKPTSKKDGCICALIYVMLNAKPRFGVQPTKVVPDKTKYNRKKKHKNE